MLALGCFLALLVAFLEKPLALFSTHHYAGADVTQVSALTRIEGGYVPHNQELSDPAVQMLPWRAHSRAELADGRFPLWNDANACGQPFFANAQSAVLSPLGLPHHLMPMRAALLVEAASKLLLAALFTWLFLRRVGLSFWPAMFGATSFAWCGHNVTLLAYPHTAAVLVLPAGLYFADVACERFWRREDGRARAFLALVVTLALGAFAGQPEPFVLAAIGVGLWACFRIQALARAHSTPDRWRRAGAVAGWLGLSALLAAGLGALQLLPFLEYLGESHLLRVRDPEQTPLRGGAWAFHLFPNLLGNPAKPVDGWPRGPQPNFELVHMATTSALVLFLAIVSLLWVRRSRAHSLFALVALGWVLYAYDVFGIARFAGAWIPGFGLAPMNRSQALGVFATCTAAAAAVEHIASRSGRERWAPCIVLVLLAVLAAFVASHAGHERLDRYLARRAAPPEFVQFARGHVTTMLLLFGAGVVLVAAKPWLRPRALGWAAGAGLVLAAFAPWGWMLRNYNPTVPDAFVYPRTEALERLRLLVRDERVLVFGADGLPPETNLVHGIEQPTGYDALGVARYRELWDAHFGDGGRWMAPERASLAGLSMVGVRMLLTRGSWLPVETTRGRRAPDEPQRFRVGPVAPGLEVVQTFTAGADGLQGLRLEVATDGRANRCTLWLVLEDVERARVVDAQSIDASALRADERGRAEIVFRFDPVRDSRGRPFRFTLSSPDATSSQCVVALGRRDFAQAERWGLVEQPARPLEEYVPGSLTQGGERVQGGLVLDLSYRRELFRRVAEFDGYTLWMYEQGSARHAFVSAARYAEQGAESLASTLADGFDPRREVILAANEQHPAGTTEGAPSDGADVHVLESEPGRARVAVRTRAPGWLVVADAWFPGWKARLDGEEVPILRANHAFRAVRLPAGSSAVEFVYEPASFRRGLWVTAGSLALLLLVLLGLRASPARR